MNNEKLEQLEETASYLIDRTGFASTVLELIQEFKKIQQRNLKYLQVLEELQNIDGRKYEGIQDMELAIYNIIKEVIAE